MSFCTGKTKKTQVPQKKVRKSEPENPEKRTERFMMVNRNLYFTA